jgi:hypothetical protein
VQETLERGVSEQKPSAPTEHYPKPVEGGGRSQWVMMVVVVEMEELAAVGAALHQLM